MSILRSLLVILFCASALSAAPLAQFSHQPQFPRAGSPVTFDASASTETDPARQIVLYEWDFNNDGIFEVSSASPTASRVFPSSGFFAVHLRVKNDVGSAATAMRAVDVAGPGSLDQSFDADGSGGAPGGSVRTAFASGRHELAQGVAVQADGKIVVVGHAHNGTSYDVALARYHPGGVLDTSFGTGGRVSVAIGSGDDFASSLVIQPDGKIVVAAYYTNGGNGYDLALLRFTATGAPDLPFGAEGTGRRLFQASGNDVPYAITLQSDGQIVVAGTIGLAGTPDVAVWRFLADGRPDQTFWSDVQGSGYARTEVGTSNDYARGVAVQPDGKIVVAGYFDNGGHDDICIVRYLSSGTRDTGFGSRGIATASIGTSHDIALGLAMQPDGKIVVGGYTGNPGSYDFALARFTDTGALDPGFGSSGKVTTSFGSGEDVAYGIALQPNGKIVLAGYGLFSGAYDYVLARYLPSGALDTTFSAGGLVRMSFAPGNDMGRAVALQADGDILVAGHSFNGNNDDFLIARFIGDSTAPTITRGGATGVCLNGVTLAGTVNPGGAETTVVFETRVAGSGAPFTSVGAQAAAQSPLAAGSAPVAVSAVFAERLQPSTTYEWRIAATNSAGARVSDTGTFTTAANQAPVASAGNGTYAIDHDMALMLSGFHSSDADAPCGDSIVRYEWDINNDGAFDLDSTLIHTELSVALREALAPMPPAGSLQVTGTLRVTDEYGATGSAPFSILFYDNRPLPAIVAPAWAREGEGVTLDGAASTHGNPSRQIVKYEWDFNYVAAEGFTVDAQGPVVTMTGDGVDYDNWTYLVALRVTDANSPPKTAIATARITVRPAQPQAEVLASKGAPVRKEGEGNPWLGVPDDAVWRSFGVPAVNGRGEMAFVGGYVHSGGRKFDLSVLGFTPEEVRAPAARKGDPAPGTGQGGSMRGSRTRCSTRPATWPFWPRSRGAG